MKKLFLIAVTLCCVGAAVAATEKKPAWNGKPTFEDFYFKMSSKLGRCGGVTIAPKVLMNKKTKKKVMPLVRVLSTKFSNVSWFSKKKKPGPKPKPSKEKARKFGITVPSDMGKYLDEKGDSSRDREPEKGSRIIGRISKNRR